MSLRCSPRSCAAPLQKMPHGHCWKYLSAKRLISSWSANRIHVRSAADWLQENNFTPKRGSPLDDFHASCAEAKLKSNVFVFALKLPVLMQKCAFNQACEEILWIFSCNCSLFRLCVSSREAAICQLRLSLLTLAETDKLNNFLVKRSQQKYQLFNKKQFDHCWIK